MKEYNDKSINNIVKLLTKEVSDIEGIVFAGGFPAALYNLMINTSCEERLLFFNYLKCGIFNSSASNFISSFGDLDFWAVKNTKAENLMNYEMSNLKNAKIKGSLISDYFVPSKWTDSTVDYIERDEPWKLPSVNLQFIIKKYSKITDIIDDFDIDACKVSWSGDTLYVSDEAESAFKYRSLSFSKDIDNFESMYNTILSAFRIIKYSGRYLFSIDKKSSNLILKIISDSSDFFRENKDLQSSSILSGNDKFLDYQSEHGNDKETIAQMYHLLFDKFLQFLLNGKFKKSNVLFLIDHPIKKVNNSIQTYLNIETQEEQ